MKNEDESNDRMKRQYPNKRTKADLSSHFMAKLITDRDTWAKWKGQMPVI